VREFDGGLPVFELKSMRAQLEETIYSDRVVAVVSVAFGALATLLAAVGIGIGLAAGVAGGRWVESELFGVRSADPVVPAGAAAMLALVALAAGGLPARRAARLDPMSALRHE
jgi:ABC-type antimicrobial peptide transport system permease subunit